MFACAAVVKHIDGRRYLDALKGIVCIKGDRNTPLANPFLIEFPPTNQEDLPKTYYE